MSRKKKWRPKPSTINYNKNKQDVMTNFINAAYGLRTKVMNFYQIRIWQEEYPGFFDWYHTTGTVVATTNEGHHNNIGTAPTDEDACILINKHVHSYREQLRHL